ncbi:hypothetical protein HHI36_001811 [Cryptolaemus montrouzieri]|uniref:CCHC-type domain-containing protein n=1 Tax=Cryptolaemus montrouzieri TaxID=559131 RepID=A0ABD2P9G3_9CUCU
MRDTSLDVYIRAVSGIVKPKHVISASIISNMRLSIFQSSKQIVEVFLSNHSPVLVNNVSVIVRSYISRDKKVTISNIPPFILITYIEEFFDSIKVHKLSAITTMKASIKDDAYSHVTCHRRQVFIKEDDIKKLRNVVRIECDGSINSIFFSTDNVMKCFKCGSVGDIAIDCSEPT